MKEILCYTLEYLKRTKSDFKIKKGGKVFDCPVCNQSYCCSIVPNSFRMVCVKCGRPIGDLANIISKEKSISRDEALNHIRDFLDIKVHFENEIDYYLDLYNKLGFDLVPIIPNGKIPIEKEWTIKEHKKIDEWKEWLENKNNLGVKCGKLSNLTIVDIDREDIPDNIDKAKGNPLIQRTKKGWHLLYLYDSELQSTRIDELKIDILNDGKQALIYPSVVDDFQRKFINEVELTPIPEELRKILKSYSGVPVTTYSEKVTELLSHPELHLSKIEEGGRNNTLISLGGLLKKELNMKGVTYVLTLFNKYFCKPSITDKELLTVIRSLEKYTDFDEKEIANKVYNYLKIVEEATSRDVVEGLGFKRETIEKVLAYLVREGFIIKKSKNYHIVKKLSWKEEWKKEGGLIDYEMPYFNDVALFRNGDMIVIGGGQKIGKSHIAMNIVKRLVEQGKKPYYVSLESGSRFSRISESLKLIEGDYYYNEEIVEPDKIELEDNAITIIDWLLPKDYAETDKIFLRLSNQLKKHGGNLIVFVQLKQDGKFFAENMVSMFPALVARYFYDNEEDGSTGYFKVEYIRETKKTNNKKVWKIPCKYNRETKTLDEIVDKQEVTI